GNEERAAKRHQAPRVRLPARGRASRCRNEGSCGGGSDGADGTGAPDRDHGEKLRSQMMRLLIAVCLSILASAVAASENHQMARVQLDHILYQVPALGAGAAAFEAQTGVKLQYGGAHTSGGTANYLAHLGDKLYLEVIGPAPGSKDQRALAMT